VSDVFERLNVKSAGWLAGELAIDDLESDKWTAHEWLHFINNLPGDLALEHFYTLDSAFGLTNSTNAEVAFAWHMKSLEGGYGEIGDSLRQFLIRVGRGKFLYPIYARLIENGQQDLAWEIFEQAKAGYHPIAQDRIEVLFAAE